ncbi:MAG TPA: hypothetical protein VNW52_12150 [Burkholderiaceae bacterium]|nr:hypothetical protein [Burkholderiaceae bacterium]
MTVMSAAWSVADGVSATAAAGLAGIWGAAGASGVNWANAGPAMAHSVAIAYSKAR